MSQYQPPYHQPPYVPPSVVPYYGAPVNPLQPARRASILMFIVGPLLMVCGVCAASMPWVIPMAPPDQSRQMFEQMQSVYHLTAKEFLSRILYSGVLITIFGLAFTLLGIWVRRGSRAPAIIASVMTGLVLLNILGGILFSIVSLGSAQAVCEIAMQLVFAGVFGTLMYLLIQAARASSSIKAAQQQYQAQYWQYQQNMQAYMMQGQQMPQGQPPMGYPTAPVVPPNDAPKAE